MANVLVTGASGFVGNNITRHLLDLGHRVHLILRPAHADWRLRDIRDDVQIHIADLMDKETLGRVIRNIRPEWVFHLAAYGAYSTQTDVMEILHANTVGTANLVLACLQAGFEAFVNTGSSSEYGFKASAPKETDHLAPNSYYAVAKAAATLFCAYTAQSSGVHIPTLRLYSVYGPYEEPSRLMPTLIVKGLNNELPPLVQPETARDFVYVDDVVEAFLLAATVRDQEPGAVYNVGTGVQTTIREVVDTARKILHITRQPEWASMPDRIWDTDTWVSDCRYIEERLGWRARYTLSDGLSKMTEWFRTNPQLTDEYREVIGRTHRAARASFPGRSSS